MRGNVGRLLLAVALLALLAVGWRAQSAFQYGVPRAPGGWLLLAASALLGLAWWLARRAGDAEGPAAAARGREWLAVAALLALGVGLRTVHFASVPAGMNHDAAFNGMFALDALRGAPYTPYISAAWGRETLFMYLCAALVAVYGNVPEPIQLAATLVGIATLPLFYLLARAMFGVRVGLFGLGLLAVSGWHVLFSRVGWRMLMVPPFEILALFGLWRALQGGGRRYWVTAGVGTALAIYTYDAGRAVPVTVAVLLGLALLRERARRREYLVGGVVLACTFLLVGAPMLWYAATHLDQFKARASYLSASEGDQSGVLGRTVTALGMFNYRGNGNDFFVREPLLEPLLGALFVFGCLVVVAGARRRANQFVLLGFALAILPGILSVPNGNRCIAALPFVFLILALGLDALAGALAGLLPPGRVRRAAPVVLASLVLAIAARETYGEFLGPDRRSIIGFSPEATAAGQYMRGYGTGEYARYVVAEDWPDYTLTYLSYNGGGTPMEPHYVLGRRLEDIEDRINRYGRKGLLFVLDDKPAGRLALERLQRLFAAHRLEPIAAARAGGRPIGTALIVEPQGAARSGLWSNSTRALAAGGATPARAVRCFAPVGDADGVSLRLQVMRPEHDAARAAGAIRLLAECPPPAGERAALAVELSAGGLDVSAAGTATAVPWERLEAGRWYEVVAALGADASLAVSVDGRAVAAPRLAAGRPLPPRIAGLELVAPAGGRFFVDDVSIVPGRAAPGAEAWSAALRPAGVGAFDEDFEATPFGRLAAAGEWRAVEGPLAALASPAAAAPAAAAAVVAPAAAGNAFDGGHGNAPGQFDQPIGVAVDADGVFYVGDKANHRVQKFARDGTFLRAWGREGEGPGEFREPHDVAADGEFVYVADLWNQRVQAFDRDGQWMFAIPKGENLGSPRGLFAAGQRLYVAEAAAARVSVYDRAGVRQQVFGAAEPGAPGHLREPTDVVVDSRGELWVINSGYDRLEHFAADGRPLAPLAVPGWSGGRLREVFLAIDAQDTLYLTDWDAGGVRRLRPDGSELPPLGSAIEQPSGVALAADRLLVAGRGDDAVHGVPLPAE